ncbi:hypothetical protein [Komagataeibacter rhaeticus]|uniref:hypothetical protein n=1 Tax=Komagataeibacter rhaeticus TaxID=215221 RepID=UPI001A4223D3|nr:hypothetical protein [Komagataeibacter rhaeticus]MBL7239596.1 hypothetical protein [Komagataeibacter rhaeticus]
MMAKKLNDAEAVVAAQQAQILELQHSLSVMGQKTRDLKEQNAGQSGDLQDISADIAALYDQLGVAPPSGAQVEQTQVPAHLLEISPDEKAAIERSMADVSCLVPVIGQQDDWQSYVAASADYLRQRNMAPQDIYRSFSATALEDLHKNIEESFGYEQVTWRDRRTVG